MINYNVKIETTKYGYCYKITNKENEYYTGKGSYDTEKIAIKESLKHLRKLMKNN